MKSFVDYCKDYLCENIDEHEGRVVFLCDFGFELTEGPNMDGTLTYSWKEAMDYLREWWWDCADYFDYEKLNYGEARNPFENPESYMVCMVIEGVRSLLDMAIKELGMDDKWNEEVEMTADLIEKVKNAVSDMYVESLF